MWQLVTCVKTDDVWQLMTCDNWWHVKTDDVWKLITCENWWCAQKLMTCGNLWHFKTHTHESFLVILVVGVFKYITFTVSYKLFSIWCFSYFSYFLTLLQRTSDPKIRWINLIKIPLSQINIDSRLELVMGKCAV